MSKRLLQGEALITAMERRAEKIEKQLIGEIRDDVTTLKYELAQVYLDGSIAALADEVARLQLPEVRVK